MRDQACSGSSPFSPQRLPGNFHAPGHTGTQARRTSGFFFRRKNVFNSISHNHKNDSVQCMSPDCSVSRCSRVEHLLDGPGLSAPELRRF